MASGGADTPADANTPADADIPGGANVPGCGTITGWGTIPGGGNVVDAACRGNSCRPGGRSSIAPRMATSLTGQDAGSLTARVSAGETIVRNR